MERSGPIRENDEDDCKTGNRRRQLEKKLVKVRGYVRRLQKKRESGVLFNKLPSGTEDEGLMHLDLCLQYMESVDMTLVDQVQKILVLMLVKRTVEFLDGGYKCKTFLLRKVQKMCHDTEKKKEVLQMGATHEQIISNLVERQRACTATIAVIQKTRKQLRNIKLSVNKTK